STLSPQSTNCLAVRAYCLEVGCFNKTCPVCRKPIRSLPTRTGTAESHNPAKHLTVLAASPGDSAILCCTSRQAAQDRLCWAIKRQKRFSCFLPRWAGCQISTDRKGKGSSVALLKARS